MPTPEGFILTSGGETKPWQLQYEPTQGHRAVVLLEGLRGKLDRLEALALRRHCSGARRFKCLRRSIALEERIMVISSALANQQQQASDKAAIKDKLEGQE